MGDTPASRIIKKGVGFVVGLAVVIFVRGFLFNFDEGGVRLEGQMEAYAEEYLDQNSLLKPGEKILAYYDYTVTLDGTEAGVLPDQRVFYYYNGSISQEIRLKNITKILEY